MSTLPIKSLDQIFDIARGGSPRPINKFITDDPDGVNWIMIGDTSVGSKYIRHTKKRILPSGVNRSRVVKPGDFLLTNSMSFGRPYILDTHGCIHDGWLVLSPKNDKVDRDYFYHLLGSPAIYCEFERLAAGATVKNLNIDLVKSVKVALPPLDEQKRIAAILDQADELRRKRQRAIHRFNQLGEAIFYEMFGDPFASGSLAGSVKLRALTTRITYGFTSPMSHQDSGIPILTAKSVKDGYIDYDNCAFASQIEFDRLTDKCKPERGDLLVTKDGTIGRCSVFDRDKVCINQSVCLVKPDHDKVRSAYLASYIRSSSVQKRIGAMKKGNAIAHLQITEFANFPIVCPSMDRQMLFEERLRGVDENVRSASAALENAKALFMSLQHRAFRGEL